MFDLFKERYSELVDDAEAFFSCLDSLQPRSFRVNRLKSTPEHIKERFSEYGISLEQVQWYEDAFISSEPEVGATFEHFTGEVYIQELVSMLPPVVIRKELEKARFVLDACAAPGSKTTQLAAIMQNRGLIVANDISYNRIRALKFNQEKAGAANVVITNRDLRNFPKNQFEIIILDAPCSSEGTIRKNFGIPSLWSEKHINNLARMQKQLILKAFDLLSPGGTMVYSTCTFAPEENEAVLHHLLENRPAKLEKILIPHLKLSQTVAEWRGTEFNSEVKNAIRIWPHHNNTGGFFLAKVKK
ncbi:RsmB/NOP family class I SAM-dependent RNA methyltransferase [Candidatus Micrarchaeota archaeon]|nr:RsmB/NOP family class I SAM-dependent RNA methyltransferase [Candidatus Micrarchaeota archaeon]